MKSIEKTLIDIKSAFILLNEIIEKASKEYYNNPEEFEKARFKIATEINWTCQFFGEQFNCSDDLEP